MTEHSPRNSARAPRQPKRAPGWIAPVVAAAVALALTWGTGTTVFRDQLVKRGLPEAIAGSSADEQAQWIYGARLADLAEQALALAELAQGEESANALANLGTSLSQGAAALGELRFDNQQAPIPPAEFSPNAVNSLATSVAAASTELPQFEEPDVQREETIARIAFQVNADAREALALSDAKAAKSLPEPLQGTAVEAAGSVACLADAALLDTDAGIDDPEQIAPVMLARAMDRGYALDYALQLDAARGPAAAADGREELRTQLNGQLARLRAVVGPDCADLRQAAYQLPDGGLEDLSGVIAMAHAEFSQALVAAAGNVGDDVRPAVAAVAFDAAVAEQASINADRPLRTSPNQ